MKAIHNNGGNTRGARQTVFNTSKIQNESNSQQQKKKNQMKHHCVQYVKDTK